MGEMKWYVLRPAGGKEKKAAEYLSKEIERSGLQDQVAQVLVPVKKVEVVTSSGKRKVSDKLLFPGYVLIQAELSAKLENIIRNLVPGMSGFLMEKKSTGGSQIERVPVPIRDEEAARILGVQDENATAIAETEVQFKVGDHVRIIDERFENFTGVVDEIIESRGKLKVLVMIFNRKNLVELSFTQVTKA